MSFLQKVLSGDIFIISNKPANSKTSMTIYANEPVVKEDWIDKTNEEKLAQVAKK